MSDKPMASDDTKRRSAEAAMEFLPEAGVLGLGTGSTAKHFIDLVAEGVRAGKRWVGVPTSEQSRLQAAELGIPLLGEEGPWKIDVTVDGADEVDADLNLIKGGGAAHTREKMVNSASARNVIIVVEDKLSKHLGEKWSVPIEVLVFGHKQTASALERWGRPALRVKAGKPVTTDAGNYVYDLAAGALRDPRALDGELRALPGVVETGLFVGRADVVIVAANDGTVRKLTR